MSSDAFFKDDPTSSLIFCMLEANCLAVGLLEVDRGSTPLYGCWVSIEGRDFGGRVNSIVVYKLGHWQPFMPVSLVVIDI